MTIGKILLIGILMGMGIGGGVVKFIVKDDACAAQEAAAKADREFFSKKKSHTKVGDEMSF